MNIIKFENLNNEDQLEINKRLIVKLADKVGETYQSYLLGTHTNMNEATESINDFSDALRFIGVRSSHFINAMLLTGFFHDSINMNKTRGDGDCYIYAVYCNETGLTKIGKTTRYNQRMKEIQSTSPSRLETIMKVKATPELETMLHHKYAGYRQHNEWFCLDEKTRGDLVSVVKRLI